jgi:hypothetical protein
MTRIRTAADANPDEALALLDALDRAHPGASDAVAEERAALRVDALVSARRIGVARDAAEVFLQRFPRSARAQHVEMLTGVHPHPAEPAD